MNAKKQSRKNQTRGVLGFSRAERKRLERHQKFLDRVLAAECAHHDAMAVATAADKFADETAEALQKTHRKLSEARKRFLVHKHPMIAVATREQQSAGPKPMVAASERPGLGDDEFYGVPTLLTREIVNELHKSSAMTGAAIDKALAFIKQSNQRIAKMERRKK